MNVTRWCFPVVMAAWAAAAAAGEARAEDTTEQIIAGLKAKAEAVKTVRADMKMTTAIMGQTMTMEGSLLAAAPQKSRMEMSMNIGPMKVKQVMISDGTTAWTYLPLMKVVQKIDMAKLAAETGVDQKGQHGADLTAPFAGLRAEGARHVRTEEVDGVEAHLFEGEPNLPERMQIPFQPAKVAIWVGAEDGLLRKSVMYDADGKPMISQEYSNIEVNVDAPDEKFQFTPPEGSQVTDMTDGVINMLKAMEPDEQ